MNESTLEAMWKEAENTFYIRTKTLLSHKPMTWEQCIEKIEAMQHPEKDPTPTGKLEKAKKWGVKMVHCLRLVGGVAATVGSVFFGPSERCFNALGVLLDVPVKLHHFHNTIATMFEVLGPALAKFRIYEDKGQFDHVHPEVNRAVHDIMISFVNICGLYQKLRGKESKWKRFRTGSKFTFLNDDSGVGVEMRRFQILTEIHQDLQATQTLNEVLETNQRVAKMLQQSMEMQRDVKKLRHSDEERTLQKRHQQHLKEIKDMLGWNESASKQSEATPKKQLDNITDGTANWFRTEEQFLAWAKGESVLDTQFRPLFILHGPQDTGKSVLMSAILRHLRTTSPTNNSSRNLVTGYFFPPPSDTKDEDRHPVRTALKCMAVQLAGQNGEFARTLRQRCDDETDIDNVLRNRTYQDLWTFLGIGSPKENTTHYIVIDGFASLSKKSEREEQMKQLFGILGTQLGSNGRVRVAISVRSDMMSLMPYHPGRNSFIIDISKKSVNDIKELINSQLKENDIFQDEGDQDRQDLVDQIAVKVQGDFSKIDTVVEQVNRLVDSCESMEDIKQALKPSDGKSTTSSDAISRLETELGAKEIDELQELLRWTMFGRKTFWPLDELNGALWLKLGTANLGKTQKKLAAKGKYSDIFSLDEDQGVWIKEEMCTLLRRIERQLETDGTPKITASFEITKGNLQSVHNFCWSLSNQVAQLSFNFDQAALAAGNVRKSFRVNEVDANISMLRSTFKILGANPNVRTQPLGRHAIAYLPQHLESLGDVGQLERQEKIDIAIGLYRIFVSGAVVDTHWEITDSSNLRWHRNEKEIRTIQETICNQSIRDNLGIKDEEWLRQVEQAQDSNRALLRPIMEKVAWRWLRDSVRSVDRPFKWIHEHLAMDSPQTPETPQDSEATAKAIQDSSKWCKDTFGIEEGDFMWFRRLGETFAISGCPERGIEAFQKAINAIDKQDPDPRLLQDLAGCYAENRQYREACETMTQAKTLLEKEGKPDHVNLGRVCYNLGLWYGRRGDVTADINNTKAAIKWDEGNLEALLHLLSTYLDDNQRNDDALEFVRGCFGIPNRMSRVLLHMMEESKDDSMFIRLFSLARDHLELRSLLLEQLNSLPGEVSEEAREKARLCSGVVFYYFCGDDPKHRNTAIDLWKQSCNGSCRNQSVALITAHHFEQAREQARISNDPGNLETHLEGMKSLGDYTITDSVNVLSHIAAWHSLNEEPSSSRESIRPCVHKAFELLSHEYDDGCWLLGTAFLRCGDDLNALSAFCCLAPHYLQDAGGNVLDWFLEPDRDDGAFHSMTKDLISDAWRSEAVDIEQHRIDSELERIREHREDAEAVETCKMLRKACDKLRSSKIHSFWEMKCDICLESWDFDNDFYRCKYCLDRDLCQRCHSNFETEAIGSRLKCVEDLACRKDHKWLFLPKWTREAYMASLAGKVMIGGHMKNHMENEVRVSGKLMLVSKWLNAMKNEWGWKTEDVSNEGE